MYRIAWREDPTSEISSLRFPLSVAKNPELPTTLSLKAGGALPHPSAEQKCLTTDQYRSPNQAAVTSTRLSPAPEHDIRIVLDIQLMPYVYCSTQCRTQTDAPRTDSLLPYSELNHHFVLCPEYAKANRFPNSRRSSLCLLLTHSASGSSIESARRQIDSAEKAPPCFFLA